MPPNHIQLILIWIYTSLRLLHIPWITLDVPVVTQAGGVEHHSYLQHILQIHLKMKNDGKKNTTGKRCTTGCSPCFQLGIPRQVALNVIQIRVTWLEVKNSILDSRLWIGPVVMAAIIMQTGPAKLKRGLTLEK